jgi:hypothetical protein
MAIQSLFGPTPAQIQEMRRQQQEQEILASGREFGVFAPLYQAGLRFGAQGRQATSALLGNQDPTLQQATAVQSVLGKYQNQDLSSPETLTKIGQELMSVAPEAGFKALTLARELTPKAEKGVTVSPGQQIVNPATGEVVYTAPEKTTKDEKAITPGQEIARAAGALGIAIPQDVREFTPEQWKAIDAEMKKEKVATASASAARLNFEDPKGQFAAITEVNSQVRPLVQQINNLDQAISLRLRSDSPFSQRLFEQTVAGAFGDAQKAATEITRLVNSGTLGQRVENTLGLFLQGKIGQATKEDQLESLSFMRDYLTEQYDLTVQPYRVAAKDKADQIAQNAATRFKRPTLPAGKQYIPSNVVKQYDLKKNQQFRIGGKLMIYNGDGTVSEVKGQ